MKRFWRDNSLSLVLFGFFFIFIIGQSLAGHSAHNQDLLAHGQADISYVQYLHSGNFAEAVFENWESEFLQMGALVILTIWLRQKGAADSKKIIGKEKEDSRSRYSIIHATTGHLQRKALGKAIYANSLSIALFGLFFISFIFHGLSGTARFNQQALLHHEQMLGLWQFMGTSQFWFESFQNWQSEFLSVGVLILFSVFLRQRHSPESKPVGDRNSRSGHTV
jgi:hypothetical protein